MRPSEQPRPHNAEHGAAEPDVRLLSDDKNVRGSKVGHSARAHTSRSHALAGPVCAHCVASPHFAHLPRFTVARVPAGGGRAAGPRSGGHASTILPPPPPACKHTSTSFHSPHHAPTSPLSAVCLPQTACVARANQPTPRAPSHVGVGTHTWPFSIAACAYRVVVRAEQAVVKPIAGSSHERRDSTSPMVRFSVALPAAPPPQVPSPRNWGQPRHIVRPPFYRTPSRSRRPRCWRRRCSRGT